MVKVKMVIVFVDSLMSIKIPCQKGTAGKGLLFLEREVLGCSLVL